MIIIQIYDVYAQVVRKPLLHEQGIPNANGGFILICSALFAIDFEICDFPFYPAALVVTGILGPGVQILEVSAYEVWL